MYIYTYIRSHVHTESVVDGGDIQVDVLFVGLYTYTHTHVCINIYTYINICVYMYIHVCIYIHIYVRIDIPRALSMEETIKSMFSLLVYIHTHTHTHLYKYIYVYKYVCIYIYTCMHIYTYICPHIHTESVVDGRDNQVDVLFIGHQRRRDVDVVVEGVKAPVRARENHALHEYCTKRAL